MPEPEVRASTQAERAVVDQESPLGVATGRTEERVLASLGQLSEAPLRFERCDDVPMGGVLCALPALLAVGLLRGVRDLFRWPKGYYPLESIFMALAFLALAGVRSLEGLRYQPPGEWGKLLGLDRLPEVGTMRAKVSLLCQEPEAPAKWGSQLAQEWMAVHSAEGGFYYVDGHVRVYHGSAALRPRAYVAREQLCLRASVDYWVNAMDGQPFFVVHQDLNERLIQTLVEEIVPRLLAEAPGQPTAEELKANPWLYRLAVALFARWCQENYFRYMMEHYALDRFVEYGAEPIPETDLVVNPQRRKLESQIRRERALLTQERARLSAGSCPSQASAAQIATFEKQQGQLLASIHQREANLTQMKDQRPTTPKKVPLKDLPKEERFTRLPTVSKHFVDTIKMIAYRAETALVGLAREKMERTDDARSLLREVLQGSANLIPDEQGRTLTVQVHPLANHAHNAVLKHLCAQLTKTETIYPKTDLRLVFEFLGPG